MSAEDDAFLARVEARRRGRMAEIDRMPPELRALVKDYGYNIVFSFRQIGISNPRHIKHLVETVLDEFSPTRGASSCQGTKRAEGM